MFSPSSNSPVREGIPEEALVEARKPGRRRGKPGSAHWRRLQPAVRMFNSSQRRARILPFGVSMSFRRVGRLAAMVLPILLCMACGQVYRPVVIPCSSGGVPGCPAEPAPTPASFHAVFGISTNVPNNPGGAMQIDVSGDSIIAETPTSDQKCSQPWRQPHARGHSSQ